MGQNAEQDWYLTWQDSDQGDLGYSLLCQGKELQPVELESSYFTILKSKSPSVFYEKKTQKQAEKSELCIALLLKMDIAKVIFIF